MLTYNKNESLEQMKAEKSMILQGKISILSD
jgi:hypothetical protein